MSGLGTLIPSGTWGALLESLAEAGTAAGAAAELAEGEEAATGEGAETGKGDG